MPTTTEKKQLTVKPEFNHFSQDVDEYTAQLPIMIRESIRQALYSEYEGNYERVEEICSSLRAADMPCMRRVEAPAINSNSHLAFPSV